MKKVTETMNGNYHVFMIEEWSDGKMTSSREFTLQAIERGEGNDRFVKIADMDGNIQNIASRGAKVLHGKYKAEERDIVCNTLIDFYAFFLIFDKLPMDFDYDTYLMFLEFLLGISKDNDVELHIAPRPLNEFRTFFKIAIAFDLPPRGARYSWKCKNDVLLDFLQRYEGKDDQYSKDRLAYCLSFADTDPLGLIKMNTTFQGNNVYYISNYMENPGILQFFKRHPFYPVHFNYPVELHPDQEKEEFEVYPYISNHEFDLLQTEMEKADDGVASYMTYLAFKKGFALNEIAGLTLEDISAEMPDGKKVFAISAHATDKGFQKKKKADLIHGEDQYNIQYLDPSDMVKLYDMDKEDIARTEKFLEYVKRQKFADYLPVECRIKGGEKNFYLFQDSKHKLFSQKNWNALLQKYFDAVGIPTPPLTADTTQFDRFRYGFAMDAMFFTNDYQTAKCRFWNLYEVYSKLSPILDAAKVSTKNTIYQSDTYTEANDVGEGNYSAIFYHRWKNLKRTDA